MAARALLSKSLLAGGVLIGAPLGAVAAELNLAGVSRYASSEQVTSIAQFSDVKPTDWAYQALSNLVERYGCVAGYPNGTYKGGQAITRFEAAALLNACLDRVTEVTDELKKLIKEFEKELAILKGRVDGLEARVGELEASQFSSTTKLSGQATFVVGANTFGGNSTADLQRLANGSEGATTFNYDLQLDFDTSFTGRDLLRIKMRAGNFADSGFGGGATVGPNQAPLFPNQLEIAFQQECIGSDGNALDCGDVLGMQRVFYQFPIGSELTATVGGAGAPRRHAGDVAECVSS